jgi:hypothetical protein
MFILNENNISINNSNIINYINNTNDRNDINDDMTKLGILSIICASILVCFCTCTSETTRLKCIDNCIKDILCIRNR